MSIFNCHARLTIAGQDSRAVMRTPPVPIWADTSAPTVTLQEAALSAWGVIRDHCERPSIARVGTIIAFGDARLQNRSNVARLVQTSGMTNDLALVAGVLQQLGPAALRQCYGAFAFVAVDTSRPAIHLVRDAMGLQPLYYARRGGEVHASSRASTLELGDPIDLEFIADAIVGGANLESHTIYSGVRLVPPGTVITIGFGGDTKTTFWSPRDFGPGHDIAMDDAADQFRALFSDAVLVDHTDTPETWAALSGGLDSSAIVCQAECLVRSGTLSASLGGTVSFYDTIGKADERRYSRAVATAYGVPNVEMENGWPWQGFDQDVPLADLPSGGYLVRRMFNQIADTVRAAGGSVYLEGLGADHYLGENLSYLGDDVVRGHVYRSSRELLEWAVAKRASFWRLATRNVIMPLVPTRLASRLVATPLRLPSWLNADFVKRFDIYSRLPSTQLTKARTGHKYHDGVAYQLQHLSNLLHPDQFDYSITSRYPFLYQPLLEFSLGLPPRVRCAPLLPKHVLRVALKDVLPSIVRDRTSKGATGTRSTWALKYERDRIAQLARDPILAELGCVDPVVFKKRFELATQGRGQRLLNMYPALLLETWLQVRAGRWMGGPSVTTGKVMPAAVGV